MPGKKRVNSGPFVCYNYECACETVVLKNSFFESFFGLPKKKGKKENPRTDFSALKSVFRFRSRLKTRNPDFKI